MAVPTICGCCGGIAVSAPSASFARFGLDRVGLRAGGYWSYRDSLVARLSAAEHGALADLRSRDPAVDFSIALLDAWASAGEVLSFYAERLTNETLLPTAQERLSLHLLSELVGYRPGPGVSASARIAFTMAAAPGAPKAIALPSGIKVQSTPGPDEKPVLFETGAAIEARPAWNAMRPQLSARQVLSTTTTQLYVAGTRSGLKPGDALYFVADSADAVFARIASVTLLPADPSKDPDRGDLTRLGLVPMATAPVAIGIAEGPPPPQPAFIPALDGVLGDTIDAGELDELLAAESVSEAALFEPLVGADPPPRRILAFRASAGTFGKTAPALKSLPSALTGTNPVYGTDSDGKIIITGTTNGFYFDRTEATWADSGTLELLDTAENYVFLDRVVEGVAAGSAVALVDGDIWGLYLAVGVSEVAKADFAITGKSTRIALHDDTGFAQLTMRGTTAWVVSEWLDLPPAPLDAPLRAGTGVIPLDGLRPGLRPGQLLALTGTLADGVDAPVAEHAAIASVEHLMIPGGRTTIRLARPLAHDFDRLTLRINANVALATHGESRFEILGSGGAAGAFQTFAAKQGPLTFVSADVPRGGKPELAVRVNGIAWKEVPDLLDAGAADRVYTLQLDESGKPRIGFGDGFAGALPAAGQDNITIELRTGIGLGGRVKAGQLNILMSRPLGLDGATNPLPSEGGADPVGIDALRAELPLYCRTLDRVVSLTDFADFALTYSGIAKARAERVKVPGLPAPGVALTVAGELAASVPPGSDLYDKLRRALAASGIPFARFMLRDFRLSYFHLAATLVIERGRIAADVVASAEQALRDEFGFERRAFAQPVYDSQVVTVLQNVPGVTAVVLQRLYTGSTPQKLAMLPADRATATEGAELVLLHPGPLDWMEAAA
jgi:hypothetical protein